MEILLSYIIIILEKYPDPRVIPAPNLDPSRPSLSHIKIDQSNTTQTEDVDEYGLDGISVSRGSVGVVQAAVEMEVRHSHSLLSSLIE